MINIFIDDIRVTPSHFDLTFRTMEEFITWIEVNPTTPCEISLDHDMGVDVMDGTTMSRKLPYLDNGIQVIRFHTSNFDGMKNMRSNFNSAKKAGLMENLEYIDDVHYESVDGEYTPLGYKVN